MLLRAGLILTGLVLQACALSNKAYVYSCSNGQYTAPKGEAASISTTTTRLLLAQRLGLSQYHNLEDATEASVQILNSFGGMQEPIFLDENRERRTEKFLAIIENVDQPADIMPEKSILTFMIDNPPSASQNRRFAIDLLLQDQHRRLKDTSLCTLEIAEAKMLRGGINSERNRREPCALEATHPEFLKGDNTIEQLRYLISMGAAVQDSTTILHISLLEGLTKRNKTQYSEATGSLKSFLRNFLGHPKKDSTIILMPPQTQNYKRTSASPYGTYSSPSHLLDQHRRQVETPLTSPDASTKDSPASTTKPHQAPPPLRGVIPVCHTSANDCVASTNNCSGHGAPYKRFIDPTSKESRDCYACNCTTTVETNKLGKKTTQWGGPACQKKDVSVPFWLLSGFSILLLALVTWSIGLLFSIGEEVLPSVIGAGVGGSRPQK